MTFTNQDRVKRCHDALVHYSDDEPYTNLIDWLADALRWCHFHDHDFDRVLHSARRHFEAERVEAINEEGKL